MLKEQVAEIMELWNDWNNHCKPGLTTNEALGRIHNLYMARFKEVVGKLTVIGDEEIDKLWEQYEKENPDQGGLDTWDKRVREAQLQDTKKQLLEGLE